MSYVLSFVCCSDYATDWCSPRFIEDESWKPVKIFTEEEAGGWGNPPKNPAFHESGCIESKNGNSC